MNQIPNFALMLGLGCGAGPTEDDLLKVAEQIKDRKAKQEELVRSLPAKPIVAPGVRPVTVLLARKLAEGKHNRDRLVWVGHHGALVYNQHPTANGQFHLLWYDQANGNYAIVGAFLAPLADVLKEAAKLDKDWPRLARERRRADAAHARRREKMERQIRAGERARRREQRAKFKHLYEHGFDRIERLAEACGARIDNNGAEWYEVKVQRHDGTHRIGYTAQARLVWPQQTRCASPARVTFRWDDAIQEWVTETIELKGCGGQSLSQVVMQADSWAKQAVLAEKRRERKQP